MKLVSRILLHLAWALSLLLGVWAVLFYLALNDRIEHEMDDALALRAETILTRYLAGRTLPDAGEGLDGYRLREIPEAYAALRPKELFSNEKVYLPSRAEREPARVLRTLFRDGAGGWHELTVMAPTIEKRALSQAVLRWVVALYAILLLMILVVTVWVLRRTMRPLYALLRWLDDYTVGMRNAPLPDDTAVEEFRRLNDAARRYAARAESLFERQKQFIGNASHEMQTPLAVCRNRLEMLVDETTLTERQLGEIAKVQQTLGYLVRLNRSLLLLTKIENGQFPETEPVGMNALARTTLEELDEIQAHRGMTCTFRDEGPLVVRMNPSLAGSLVSNLLKNAFVHGRPQGRILVQVAPRWLEVANDATDGPLDAARIFDRFYHDHRKAGSTGLGLAIVDAVCRLYGLQAEYAFEKGMHRFRIRFPESVVVPQQE